MYLLCFSILSMKKAITPQSNINMNCLSFSPLNPQHYRKQRSARKNIHCLTNSYTPGHHIVFQEIKSITNKHFMNNKSFWDPNHFNIVAIFPKIACRCSMSFSSTVKTCNERRIIFLCGSKEFFINFLLFFRFKTYSCLIKDTSLFS